eukprot:414241_1
MKTAWTSIRPNKSLINSHKAAELIKYLSKQKPGYETQVIQDAFEIYNRIDGAKNYHVINALMQLVWRLKHPHKILSIWNDITNIKTGINYTLLFKCCMNDTNKCVTILQWIKYNNCTLKKHGIKDHSMNVVKLISKNKKNIQLIKQIHSLLNIDGIHSDIFIKTALIEAYGECMDINEAKHVFESISKNKKDSISLGVLMKGLIKNQRNDELLSLYEQYNYLNNDVTQMYALQACINNNYYDKGLKIIHNIQLNKQKLSDQLQNTMINFYGNFDDIKNAINIFNDIQTNGKNQIINVNVMLKSFVNNGYNNQCLLLYDKYKYLANDISHTLALKVAMDLNDYNTCKQIHNVIANTADCSIELCSTLIDFYGQIGDITEAKKIFDSVKLEKHTTISIGCMMKVLHQNQYNDDAIILYETFDKLQNDVTHLYAIKTCIDMNDFEKGKYIHENIGRECEIKNVKLVNTLIDFYGYFGDISYAMKLFNDLCDDQKDFVTIGSMMNAFIINNENENVISLYHKYKLLMD